MAAVCLERFPLIAPPPTDLDIRYKEMLRKMEDEKSLLSYHELRRMEDARAAKKAEKGAVLPDSEERQIITAQDFEDASATERKQFTFAPRASEQTDSNLQSLNRLLDKKLVFLVPSFKANSWRLPTTLLRQGETLAQAAQRCLEECLDVSPAASFYGYAPRKLYRYVYPKPVAAKTGADGAKVFLFKAELAHHSKVTPQVEQFRWLSRSEIDNTVILDQRYRQCVYSFIFE